MSRLFRTATVAALILSALAAPAWAAQKRMVTYDSASPAAKRLTGAGLTFVFTKSMLRTRILAVRATAVPVGVLPRVSTDGSVNRKLDALMGDDAGEGTLYEIDPKAAEGKVMIQAFCPGSKSGWLSVGTIAHMRDLRVHAFGDDPATGEPRLCAVMDFSFRGEWRMPGPINDGVTDRVFRPDYGRPGS
ncbi:MAG: hypothetical protein HY859_20020 [Caulobacterales bacterium]|nr:hypothetical protein [Caulobacterales bacterium]